jgi:phage/plasmid primase-like uncharacterized protein
MTFVNLSDIERQALSFMKGKGITLPDGGLNIDGEIHRYATEDDKPGAKAGAYQIWPDGKNHDGKPHGWFKDWRQGITIRWQYDSKDNPPPREKPTKKEMAEIKAKTDADKRAQLDAQNKATVQARQFWENAHSIEDRGHPYLIKKRVNVYGDMRISADRKLLIFPWRDIQTSELVTIHTIDANGNKRWHKGAPKRGGYVIESNEAENCSVIVTEGAATALSIYEALSSRYTVIAAGDCGSLKYAAEAARKKWPEHEIYVAADDDWKSKQSGRKNHGLEAATPLLEAGLVDGILLPPFDKKSGDATDWNDYASICGIESTREALEKQIGESRKTGGNPRPSKEKHDEETALSEAAKRQKPDQAIVFYQMMKDCGVEAFKDEETGMPLVKFPSGGRFTVDWLHSEHFLARMSKMFAKRELFTISNAKIGQSLKLLVDDANSVPKRRTYVRLAGHADAIYLDLCDEEYNAVKIDECGWNIITDSPIMFRRGDSSQALPYPEHGGSLNMLREFINADDDSFVLLVGWLLSALSPTGGFPLLAISAEAGSGKSTITTLVSKLIDPHSAERLSLFKDEDALVSAAASRWIVPFDNVSGLSSDKSDALCRLATGGGLSKRKLYTDNDNFTCNVKRPVILNGIELNLSRLDLLDRATIVKLKTISEWRPESDIYDSFAKQRPFILGSLLDAVSTALKERNWKPPKLPRMADATAFILRAEKGDGLPWLEGTYQKTLENAEDAKRIIALDTDLVGCAILRLIEEGGGNWSGSMGDLYSQISDMMEIEQKRYLPQIYNLGRKLTELAPLLRQEGITIERKRKSKGFFIYIWRGERPQEEL